MSGYGWFFLYQCVTIQFSIKQTWKKSRSSYYAFCSSTSTSKRWCFGFESRKYISIISLKVTSRLYLQGVPWLAHLLRDKCLPFSRVGENLVLFRLLGGKKYQGIQILGMLNFSTINGDFCIFPLLHSSRTLIFFPSSLILPQILITNRPLFVIIFRLLCHF